MPTKKTPVKKATQTPKLDELYLFYAIDCDNARFGVISKSDPNFTKLKKAFKKGELDGGVLGVSKLNLGKVFHSPAYGGGSSWGTLEELIESIQAGGEDEDW